MRALGVMEEKMLERRSKEATPVRLIEVAVWKREGGGMLYCIDPLWAEG